MAWWKSQNVPLDSVDITSMRCNDNLKSLEFRFIHQITDVLLSICMILATKVRSMYENQNISAQWWKLQNVPLDSVEAINFPSNTNLNFDAIIITHKVINEFSLFLFIFQHFVKMSKFSYTLCIKNQIFSTHRFNYGKWMTDSVDGEWFQSNGDLKHT